MTSKGELTASITTRVILTLPLWISENSATKSKSTRRSEGRRSIAPRNEDMKRVEKTKSKKSQLKRYALQSIGRESTKTNQSTMAVEEANSTIMPAPCRIALKQPGELDSTSPTTRTNNVTFKTVKHLLEAEEEDTKAEEEDTKAEEEDTKVEEGTAVSKAKEEEEDTKAEGVDTKVPTNTLMSGAGTTAILPTLSPKQ